jgi:hypothetical protein
MPAPTPAATSHLLSWLRQGLLAGMTTAAGAGTAAGHLVLPVRLRLNHQRDLDVPVQLYGPGDVTGLERGGSISLEPDFSSVYPMQ